MGHIQVLHMNKGKGETSYANNSIFQRKIISMENPIIWEAIAGLILNTSSSSSSSSSPAAAPVECMSIADLGCSSGPNTLVLVSEVIERIYENCREMRKEMPELRVFLNDLHGNDFNNIFMSLPGFFAKEEEEEVKKFGRESCFISGVPGSFYGRLFPKKSMHFIHSSSSLHWLSQGPPLLDSNADEPLNKGKLYISKTSPLTVRKAYHSQFHKDFSLFLKSRAKEMVSGGRMVLSFIGRSSSDPTTEDSCHQWELLAEALTSLVSYDQQLLQEKIDSFNAPYYGPSMEEVKKEVEEEGSFEINFLESFEINWDEGFQSINDIVNDDQIKLVPEFCNVSNKKSDSDRLLLSRGEKVAKTVRAVVETMLENHFGKGLDMEALFKKYGELADDYFSKAKPIYINLIMSFTRK